LRLTRGGRLLSCLWLLNNKMFFVIKVPNFISSLGGYFF